MVYFESKLCIRNYIIRNCPCFETLIQNHCEQFPKPTDKCDAFIITGLPIVSLFINWDNNPKRSFIEDIIEYNF